MIIGLLALAAFIQLVRTNEEGSPAKESPVDDDDPEDDVDSDDEDDDDDDDGAYHGQAFGILADPRFKGNDLKFGFDDADVNVDAVAPEEDEYKEFSAPVGRYGVLQWKTGESPDKLLKDMQLARMKSMPTMEGAYEMEIQPTGKHAINLNVYEEWNMDQGNAKYGQADLERLEKKKCGKRKTQTSCRECCDHAKGSGIVPFSGSWGRKKMICVCREADLSP